MKTFELPANFTSTTQRNNTTITQIHQCIPTALSNFIILITLIILPFHLLMIKVLHFDLRLALARHMITFCLSISDALFVLIIFSCATVMKIFRLTTEEEECNIIRKILYFELAMSLVVSSLSIIAFSSERYVACIHSFRLHEIFTKERVTCAISCIWITGVICGAVTIALGSQSKHKMIMEANEPIKVMLVLIVIPTIILVTVIQSRLLVFSRSKLVRVGPTILFGSKAEMAGLRKRQIKIAFVASIVFVKYVVSMYPAAFLSYLDLIKHDVSSPTIRGIMKALMILNNFADPYIYGIGMVDTRRALFKHLRKMKNLFTRQL